MDEEHNWGQKYGYYVLEELKAQKHTDEVHAEAIRQLELCLERMKVRYGLLGAGSGGAAAGLFVLIWKLVVMFWKK